MYIKDLMINPIISLPVASFIVLSSQPLRTKKHTSYILLLRPFNSYEFEGVDYFTNLPHPYSHSYQKLANHCLF